jgi:hypothetical protein
MDETSLTGDGAPSTTLRLIPVAFLFFAVAPNVTLKTGT